jgi:ubiquinone/menaquinone biosynthesis C-methylase UbiE
MQISPGDHVLDVGCGAGIDTIALAGHVGPAGLVVGIDSDDRMITQADLRAQEAAVSAWVMHKQAEATALSFQDNEFHSSRSERLFQHLQHPEQVLKEMIRVTKPNGRIVVMDTDWAGLSIDSNEIEIERKIVRTVTERLHNNGYAGRQLYRLFKQNGFENIGIEILPHFTADYQLFRQMASINETELAAIDAGLLTPDEIDRWRRDLERFANQGTFFACVNLILLSGTKIL